MNSNKLLNEKKASCAFALIILILFSSFPLYYSNYSVHGQFLSTEDTRNPLFLDSYWTDTPSTNSSPTDLTTPDRIEVGPGEGPSTLAVVIVNTGRTDITGLKGYLTLPDQFRSIPGQNGVNKTNVSVASYNAIVKPGESFPLYFSLDVLRNATVGPYVSSLDLVYSQVQEVGQISTTLELPFRITGKVILDTTSLTQNLTTGTLNKAIIAIKNEGSADANGVIATITNLNGNTVTNLGDSSTNSQNENMDNNEDNSTGSTTRTGSQDVNETNQTASNIATLEANTFDIGKIRANELVTLRPLLYADYNAGGTIQSMNLEISYNDAYGNKKTLDTSVGIVVSPNPPESTLSIRPIDNGSSLSNMSSNNNAKNEIQQSQKNNEVNSGDSITISSGKIEEMKFVVTNTGSSVLENAILSLSSPSDSVKILGNTRWSVPLFTPGMEKEISTLVFASEDMINKPISFTINAEYIAGGKTRSDVLNLGAYVEGQIKVTLYDLAINEIGGFPNLVGNLLNEGNTMAFFTRLQAENDESITSKLNNSNNTIASSETGLHNKSSEPVNRVNESNTKLFSNLPPSQYLGDLTENSPLPFGIPINITQSLPSGVYPITLKISFKDNLRNDQIITLNDTVTFKANAQEKEQNDQNILGINYILFVSLIIILVAILLTVYLIRRKRKRLRKKTEDAATNDLASEKDNNGNESLFDDQT